MNVFDLSVGSICKIVKVSVEGSAKSRLNYLGIKEGNKAEVLGFSLLNSSVLLGVGYTRIAIRKTLAKGIEVKLICSPQQKRNGVKRLIAKLKRERNR
jgi:Fe2+ transport system protein FeoA